MTVAPARKTTKRGALPDAAVRVLRALCDRVPGDDNLRPLIVAAGYSDYRLYESLRLLEMRWLVTWENHGQIIRPRQRGRDLLLTAAYRERGL